MCPGCISRTLLSFCFNGLRLLEYLSQRWRLRTFLKNPIATDPRTQKTKDYTRHYWQFVDVGLSSIRNQAEGDNATMHEYVHN